MNQLTTLTPQNWNEAMQFAEMLAKSTIVPKDYQGNPGNILVAVQWGAEIGLQPLQAMQNIAVINGRPAIWGDAMLALVRGSGKLESIDEQITDSAATCTITRKGEAPLSRTFSLEDAKRAGLTGKAGPWTQYPKRMMQMRARSWAMRDAFADVLRGMITGEEAEDMPAERSVNDAPAPAAETKKASRAEQARAKLAQKAADPISEQIALATVLNAIEAAETPDALAAVAPMSAALHDDDKEAARAAYRARASALKGE